jgi:hypothetical protein
MNGYGHQVSGDIVLYELISDAGNITGFYPYGCTDSFIVVKDIRKTWDGLQEQMTMVLANVADISVKVREPDVSVFSASYGKRQFTPFRVS